MIRPELTPQDANSCLDLMRAGLKAFLDTDAADAAVDAYVRVREALKAGAQQPKPKSDEN